MAHVSKHALNKVLLRTQGCQFAHNYERMQSLSLTYCFSPVLEELYKDRPKEERVTALKRYLEYFNTHPLAIPLILGICAALEESTDEDHKDAVTGVKTSLMGPFAGLGDSMLNLTWYPIAGSIGASLCVDNGSLIGPIVMFLLINLLYWPMKYFGVHMGYSKGMELIEKGGLALIERLGNLANVLGVIVVGCLIPQTVKLTIFGPCAQPYVIIGTNRYEVDVTVPSGSRLEIDGTGDVRTVTMVSGTGLATNCFAQAVRGSGKDSGRYVFQPLAPGTQPISWPGGFQFDLTVCEERSEPPWT